LIGKDIYNITYIFIIPYIVCNSGLRSSRKAS
jgi:hypothetical protein